MKMSYILIAILATAGSVQAQNIYRKALNDPFPNIEAMSSGAVVVTNPDEPVVKVIPDINPNPNYRLESRPISYNTTATAAYVALEGETVVTMSSCLDYIEAGLGQGVSGVYLITNNNLTYPTYCNQTSHGGGFTAVAVMQENDRSSDWANVTSGFSYKRYDVTLDHRTQWAYANALIPPHSQLGFSHQSYDGKNVPRYLVNYTYHTGNLPKEVVTDNNGVDYHIYRNYASYYPSCDPESTLANKSGFNGGLTIDAVGKRGLNFCFFPYYSIAYYNKRGAAYAGADRSGVIDYGNYVLWVR